MGIKIYSEIFTVILNLFKSHHEHVYISYAFADVIGEMISCVNTWRIATYSGLPPASAKCLGTHNKYLMIGRYQNKRNT